MKKRPIQFPRQGFTLVEVLAALGLCALLAAAVASAVAFAARAEESATRRGEAALLIQTLYASQRLRPDDGIVAVTGWRVDGGTDIETLPDGDIRTWHLLEVTPRDELIPTFTLRILDDTP